MPALLRTIFGVVSLCLILVFRRTPHGQPAAGVDEPSTALGDAASNGPKEHHVRVKYVVVGSVLACALLATSIGAGWLAGSYSQHEPTVVNVPATTAPDWSAVYATVAPSTVIVRTANSSGTGFFTSVDKITTAAHVLTGDADLVKKAAEGRAPQVEIKDSSGTVFPATVDNLNIGLDVAVLTVARKYQHAPLAWSDTLPATGTAVAIIGAPYGHTMMLTSGVISASVTASVFASGAGENVLLSTDAPTNPGASGGPLVDAAGRVVGMVTLRPEKMLNRPVVGIALAVPSALLRNTVTALSRGQQPVNRTLGITVSDSATGPLVKGVTASAQAAGLATGDVVTRVQDVPVGTVAQLIAAVSSTTAKDLKVTVTRDGQTRTLTVPVTETKTS